MNGFAFKSTLLSGGDAILRLLFRPGRARGPEWPDGKSFALTIIDDTDESTLDNVQPIYSLLADLGMRTTKTVWSLESNDESKTENRGDTLADPAYRDFVVGLQRAGFEIASHGARGGSSERDDILAAMEIYRSTIGQYPDIHINHASNRDNVYWGPAKLSSPMLQRLYRGLSGNGGFSGEDPDSKHYWGDFIAEHVRYVVDFSFNEIDLLRVNPGIPFRDPDKTMVGGWFHTSDGGTTESFTRLLSERNLDRLEARGGACIVYTHFGKGFCHDGAVLKDVEACLRRIARRAGWFVPATQMLDRLADHNGGVGEIDRSRSNYIQYRWMLEKLLFGAS
jgi:hypothetical protein